VVLPHRHHHTWGIAAAAAAAVLSTGAAVTITARPTDDCRDSSDCGSDCQDRSDIDRDNDLVSEADFSSSSVARMYSCGTEDAQMFVINASRELRVTIGAS